MKSHPIYCLVILPVILIIACTPLEKTVPERFQPEDSEEPLSTSDYVFDIKGPTVIAFVAQFTESQVDTNQDLVDELDDFGYYWPAIRKTVQSAGMVAYWYEGSQFKIRRRGQVESISLPAESSTGFFLYRPSYPDKQLTGVHTDIDFVEIAEDYFGIPLLAPR